MHTTIARALLLAAALACAPVGAGRAHAQDAVPDSALGAGQRPFAFAAWVVDGGGGPDLVRVRCSAVARADSAPVTARVRVLPPLAWVSGDTARTFRQGRAPATWDVIVRAPRGPYALEGVGAAERFDGASDEVAWRLDGRAPATAGSLPTARLLYEHRRLGRLWFRSDGPVLVPADSSERCVDDDIVERARALATAPVRDALVFAANGRRSTMNCVLCVDARGRVTAVRPASGRMLERRAYTQLVREVRSHWSFAPARTRRGPVADCVEAELQVGEP
jgi:hypothetical protein